MSPSCAASATREGRSPVHPVIDSLGCTACHEAHASDNPTLLKQVPVQELCKTCHPARSTFPTAHAGEQGKCLDCHDPHASAGQAALKGKPELLCARATRPSG